MGGGAQKNQFEGGLKGGVKAAQFFTEPPSLPTYEAEE